MEAPDSPGGLFSSFRSLLDSSLSLIQRRVELLAVELQEEKYRLIDLLLWTAIGIVLAILTLVTATALAVYLLWDISPVGVLVGITLLYGLSTWLVVAGLRKNLRTAPRPFSETLGELAGVNLLL